MNLTYSEMKPNHYDPVLELWKDTPEIVLNIGDSKNDIERYLQRNPGLSFVCQDEQGNVIGSILCGHDGRRGFMYNLAVHRDFRNQSIGKKLSLMALNKLKEQGIERCIIMVKDFNDVGARFWEINGWKKRNEIMMYSLDLA